VELALATKKEVVERPAVDHKGMLSVESNTISNEITDDNLVLAKQEIYRLFRSNQLTYGAGIRESKRFGFPKGSRGYRTLLKYAYRLKEVRSRCRIEVGSYGTYKSRPFGIQCELLYEYPSPQSFYDSLPEETKVRSGAKLIKDTTKTTWVYRDRKFEHLYATHQGGKTFWRNLERNDVSRALRLHIKCRSDTPIDHRIKGKSFNLPGLGVLKFGDHSDPNNVELEICKRKLRILIDHTAPKDRMALVKSWCGQIFDLADRITADFYKELIRRSHELDNETEISPITPKHYGTCMNPPLWVNPDGSSLNPDLKPVDSAKPESVVPMLLCK
jgi:hypothetical protein